MKTVRLLLLLLIVILEHSSSLSESRIDEDHTSERIVGSEVEECSKSRKDMEVLKALLRQTSEATESGNGTVTATRQGPCECVGGICSCCSRILYDTWKQKACVNVTYDPDEFSFTATVMMNDRVLFKRTVSGKNPRPVCVPVPRITFIKACLRFYNIYFQGRNIHLCLDMEGKFRDTTLFKVGFDCFRFGANGLALVKPEDGGGLGQVEILPDGVGGNDDDYDYSDEDDDDDDDDLF